MSLMIPKRVMAQIQAHLEAAYPDEGAGLMLGVDGGPRRVDDVITLPNSREPEARRNRYLITSQDMLVAEVEALHRGLEVLGVFHSHPDHPSQPSEYDREYALPYYSYLIVSGGAAARPRIKATKARRSLASDVPVYPQRAAIRALTVSTRTP